MPLPLAEPIESAAGDRQMPLVEIDDPHRPVRQEAVQDGDASRAASVFQNHMALQDRRTAYDAVAAGDQAREVGAFRLFERDGDDGRTVEGDHAGNPLSS